MNNCSDFALLLSLQLDGMLSEAEASALEDHLAHCPACRSLQADLARLHRELAALSFSCPPDLGARVAANIRAQEGDAAQKPKARPIGLKRYRSLLASAAVFALLISAVALGQGLGKGATEQAAPLMASEDAELPSAMSYGAEIAEEFELAAADESIPEPVAEPAEGAALNDAAGAESEKSRILLEPFALPEEADLGDAQTVPNEGAWAEALLLSYLSELGGAEFDSIVYEGFDAETGAHRFRLTYPDQSQAAYGVDLRDGGIFSRES